MKRIQTIEKLIDCGVVAVVRAADAESALKVTEAIVSGGIKAIEITMTVPGALEVIKELVKANKDTGAIIGAGTVLDPETARLCMLAGAEFIVSPNFNVETVKLCNRYRMPVMPGVMTVNEAIEALEYGVEIIKVFPGSAFGPSIIGAFRGPLPQGNFMPTGGVSLDNAKDWIKKGAVMIGIGGELTRGAETGDYEKVRQTAASFVNEVRKARGEFC